MVNISGTSGNDIRVGTTGDERFIGSAGNDSYQGGGGFDGLDYDSFVSPVSITIATPTGSQAGNTVTKDSLGTDTFQDVSIFYGSASNDRMEVTAASSSVNIFLYGGGGNDTLIGNGLVRVYADYYSASLRPAVVDLAAGTASTNGGTDTLINIASVRGSVSDDTLLGTNGDNRFIPLAGINTVDGRGGFDILFETSNDGAVVDATSGTSGTVRTTCSTNGSGFTTYTNIEVVVTGNGADLFNGSSGNDRFAPAGGNDTINGGDGFDTVDYSHGVGVPVLGIVANLKTGIVTDYLGNTDILTSIESVRGSRLNDGITGSDGNDTLFGMEGDDTLVGGAGRDILDGGLGTDTAGVEGSSANWRIVRQGDEVYLRNLASGETDHGISIERLAFGTGAPIDVHALPSTSPLEYVASFGDLMAAFGTDAAAGWNHLFQSGLTEERSASFDSLAYIASYGDLSTVLGANEEAGARHYIQAGRFEGRAATFDGTAYLASHTDLQTAFGKDVERATAHYIQAGRLEGRGISFDGLAYAASYDDLTAAFATNARTATAHYVQNGRGEGRSVTFDAYQYIASYGDLIGAFGTDAQAAKQHWLTAGYREGRVRDNFDAARYLTNYTDLQNAFGTDEQAATLHYIVNGYNEGRTDHLL